LFNVAELHLAASRDGWVFDRDGWCVFLENKVIAKLSANQIKRHRHSAERRGFKTITAVAITPTPLSFAPPDTVALEWRTIYAWLRRHASKSRWAQRAAEYLEIAEAKLIDAGQFREGTLTMFAGFPFGRDHPFTYLEDKRVLELALTELRCRRDLRKQLKMNPKAPGRPAITGRRRDGVREHRGAAPWFRGVQRRLRPTKKRAKR
jgi:hypothetical protein